MAIRKFIISDETIHKIIISEDSIHKIIISDETIHKVIVSGETIHHSNQHSLKEEIPLNIIKINFQLHN